MANIMKIFTMIGVITMLAFSVSAASRLEKATFAGGYKDNPAYEEASSGKTGHVEAIEVTFDPSKKKVSQEAVPQVTGGKWRTFMKPSRDELKKRLTAMQYKVTQENGTEPAFRNEYAENKREGIYVDVVSGEPLYSSLDKYDSGTGWPSFTRPLEPGNIVEKEDRNLFFMKRTEVRSKHGDSHLGHVFDDGPKPTGLRYCMNSAALRFIAKEDLVKEGYGEYLTLFKRQAVAK